MYTNLSYIIEGSMKPYSHFCSIELHTGVARKVAMGYNWVEITPNHHTLKFRFFFKNLVWSPYCFWHGYQYFRLYPRPQLTLETILII